MKLVCPRENLRKAERQRMNLAEVGLQELLCLQENLRKVNRFYRRHLAQGGPFE